MPMNTGGRSTKQGKDHPLGHVEWSLPVIRKGIKVTHDMSYPTASTNTKVTIRSLEAYSPEYLVPLMAAVTHHYSKTGY